MEVNKNVWAKLLQEIKSPRGGRYLALGGVLIAIIGCVGMGIGGAIIQNSAEGSTGSTLAALMLLVTLLMMVVGIIITIIGGIVALIQKKKEKAQIVKSNPLEIYNQVSTPVVTENKSERIFPVFGSIPTLIQKKKEKVQTIKSNPSVIRNEVNTPIVIEKQNKPERIYPLSTKGLTIELRREILQQEINKYLRKGYRVISQTDTTAQLIKPKTFSCLWFLIYAILLIGWIFYLAWYWSKRDKQVYIEVDVNGVIRTRK